MTGGCGFIGSNLIERLIHEGHSITVFDNLHTGSLKNMEGFDVTFHNEPFDKIDQILPKTDMIFHFGMRSSTPMYKRNPLWVGETIRDAIKIFEYAKAKGCKVVYASSSIIYNGNEAPYNEDMPVFVTDFYTEARYAMERLAKLYNTLYGVKSGGMRFFSVYGPREEYKKQYANIISQSLWWMRSDEPPVIYGNGTQTRDFTYVSDVVAALMLAWKKDFECEVFNVGTGVAHSFNRIVEILNRLLEKDVKPIYKPNPIKNYVYHTLADTKRAEKKLGFKAKTRLEDGIIRLIQHSP